MKNTKTPRPKQSAKGKLFNEVLKQLQDANAYFSFREVTLRVKELDLKISAGTLRVYLTEATASGLIHNAGRGWYSRLSEPLTLDPKPVAKLVRAVEKAFPLLAFTCWSTAQVNPFMRWRWLDTWRSPDWISFSKEARVCSCT
jgi:hypothetical protein